MKTRVLQREDRAGGRSGEGGVAEGEEEACAEENKECDAPTGLAIDLWEEVGGRDVDGDAARKRKGVFELGLQEASQGDAGQGCHTEASGGLEGPLPALATGQDHGGYREALRQLMEKHGEKENDSQPSGDEESRGDGHTVEKRVNEQAEKGAGAGVLVTHGFGVGLFPEMEMRRQGVLEEMHQEKTNEDVKERAIAGELHRFGNNFEKCHGEHIARAKGQEKLEKLARPIAPHDEVTAEQISACGHEAEDGCRGDSLRTGWDHRQLHPL